MTKLLQNKTLIKFLGIALSILLIVALIPQIGIAYGSKDDVVGETPMAETGEGDEATDEGEEAAADGDESATPEEGTEPAEGEDAIEGEVSVVDGVEMVSHKVEVPGEENEDTTENAIAPQSSEDEGKKAARVQSRMVLDLEEPEITIDQDVDYTKSGPLTFNEDVRTRTLNIVEGCTFKGDILVTDGVRAAITVNGTLNGDILITGGAKVTIKGAGTINGTHTSSVITVEGAGSELILGGEDDKGAVTGPTVTNGWGTIFSGQENKRVGGGVFVKRTNTSSYDHAASFWMKAGTIYDNTAQAGGGIYVDAACGFTMDGGTVDKNTAEDSEGGGIFVTGALDYNFNAYAKINAGNITNNTTNTTYAWGGGGVFVNSGGALNISSASIDHNTAEGLGGGVSGCPHASIAVTTVTNGAAIFQNEAKGTQFPTNGRLRLLDTDSVIQGNEGKRVAAGDFLFDGLYKTAELKTSWKDGIEGRWSGSDASEKSTSVFAQYGDYGKRADIAQYARDFYCTRASYIAPTNLGDENGVAWRGLEIGIPVVNAKATVLSNSIKTHAVEILVANEENTAKKLTSYASLDATLGLTSEAKEDPYAGARKVNISGNYSATHGGGVASNGALEFGSYDWKDESFEKSYELVLSKEIFNDQGMEIGKNDDGTKSFNGDERFSFTLVEEDGTTHHAVNAADGTISFPGLPGLGKDDFNDKTSVEKTVEFKLSEDSVDGYDELPEMTVKVTLEGTKKVSKFLTASNSMHTSTVYETEIKEGSVEIDGKATNTVRNTLNLKASESIPVKKIADGLYSGEFKFALKEVAPADGDITVDENNNVILKDGQSLLTLPVKEGTEEERTIWVGKSVDGPVPGTTTPDAEDEEYKDFSFTYEQPGTHWYVINEKKEVNIDGSNADAAPEISYDETAYLVKIDVAVANGGRSLKTTKIICKAAPGSTTLEKVEKAEGDIGVTFTNVKMEYAPFNLALNKQVVTTLPNQVVGWNDLSDVNKKFHFSVYDPTNNEVIFEGENEGSNIDLEVVSGKESIVEGYVKAAYQEYLKNPADTFGYTINNLKLKEEMPAGVDRDDYMTLIEDADVTITLGIESAKRDDDNTSFQVTPEVKTITLNGTRVEESTVSNLYEPHGDWTFTADKHFQGLGEPAAEGYGFAMVELDVESDDEIKNAEQLANLPIKKDSEGNELTWAGRTGDFQKNEDGSYEAQITFDPVSYVVKQGNKFDVENGENHYYLVTETAPEGGSADTTAFVVKVNVKQDETNKTVLAANEVARWYADDVDQAIADTVDVIEFYNTDTQHMISAASYSVYAASGEPVDKVCYVDPKIIKNLEGRAIKSGEFAFKLIEVANHNDTEGTVISATTNDEFGMVDFDKANNVSGNLENPSCLAYTNPGIYYYRVIEDTTKGGMNDQSVLYSDQVITFTTVIDQDKATGRLVCTDMYYGYWDKAANKNVRYDEQYTDFDTQPANIGDMSKLNPDWHPTITNKTRPMDIQVRKTSVTDRSEGLVGATYALYMVNENAQGDIKLAEATSEDGGWITYKNVSLSTNNLYYFKETAAPAGHTVSEFRSSYFYLVEDASSANGYALQYTDSKYLPEAAADEAAVQAEVSGTVQAKNAPAAQADTEAANEAAADTETQPGYSADGNVLLTYDKDGGVYDEVTTLEVNKLDTRTHEWVEGAKLVIIEKESGKEIASWTSGEAPQKLEKTLNVGTTYLLREVEAPDQYRLANDVEFVIDDYGNVSITKGTENGNAELSDNTIALYDTMLDAEETETIEREKSTTEKPNKDTLLAKTGDMLPILGIALVALAALIVVIVAVRRRRAGEDSASNE